MDALLHPQMQRQILRCGSDGWMGSDQVALAPEFRRAGRTDAAKVQDLFCRSYADTFGHTYQAGVMERWFEESCTLERFEGECTDADFAIFLAEDGDGRLLGYCTLGPYDITPETVKMRP